MANAGYDLYTLLDTIIDRLSWPSETERIAAHDSVQAYRDVSLFGNMATLIQCSHDNIVTRYNAPARCLDCGRLMT